MITSMYRTLFLLTLFCFVGSVYAQDEGDAFLYFEFGKHSLTQESRNRLDLLARAFTADDSLQVEIFGNADSVGSDAFNITLAENRCREVWNYLDEKEHLTIKKAAMSTSGEHYPLLSNKSGTNRSFNRRVLVSIRKLQAGSEAPYPLVVNGKIEGTEGYAPPTTITDIVPIPPAPTVTETPPAEKPEVAVVSETPPAINPNEMLKAKGVVDPLEEERQKNYQNTLIKARKMLRKGMSIEDVMEFTDLDKTTVEKLKETVGVLKDD
ncbi:MAG: OmpA family protein [Bacteroidia bacterium]